MARHKKADRDQARKETRQQLLMAASEEFAREGYDGANINRISLAAGYAKGTIYNYFPSKRALMTGLIAEIAQAHVAYVVERVQRAAAPDQRLAMFFESGFDFVATHLPQARVMITTLYGHDAEFRMHMYQAYQPLFQLISREIIAPGIAQDQFRPVNAQAMAGLLMTIYLGTSSQISEEGQFWIDHRMVADFSFHALRKLG